MIESRFWVVIGEPRGDCSRLRDQAPRKHDFAWWRCGQKALERDLAQLSEGIMCPEYTAKNHFIVYTLGTSSLTGEVLDACPQLLCITPNAITKNSATSF